MSRRPGESGQAVVGVLVVTALVFGLAGGLVMVSSALLAQERAAQSPLAGGLGGASAINAAIAQVADRGVSSTSGSGLRCTQPSALTPGNTGLQPAGCLRVDNLSTATGDRGRFSVSAASAGTCATSAVLGAVNPDGSPARILVWVISRGSGAVWVNSSATACGQPAGTACAALGNGLVNGVMFNSFDCFANWHAGDDSVMYVHMTFSRQLFVWWAKYAALDGTGATGSVYVLAIPTGLPAVDMIEAELLAPSDAKPSAAPHDDSPLFLFRGPLS